MRGKDPVSEYLCQLPGITPAYAGKSRILTCNEAAEKDHPRVCGEKYHDMAAADRRVGITPAYAGKSIKDVKQAIQLMGSPPRMRGKVSTRPLA